MNIFRSIYYFKKKCRGYNPDLLAKLSTAQAGQDYWVYGETFNEKTNGYFVDLGAHNGCHLSNTYLLEGRYNWNGICIEANPKTFEQLRKNRN